MRRRWRVNWPDWVYDTPPFGIFAGLCAGLFGFGLAVFIVGGLVKTLVSGNDLMNGFLYAVLAVGLGGPIALFLVGCLAAGIVLLVRHWPIRRVTESSPDIREVYRGR